MKHDKDYIASILTEVEMSQKGENEWLFTFHSAAAMGEFLQLKHEWLSKVMKKFNNFHIQIDTVVNKEETKSFVLNDREKLAKMAEKNPWVDKLFNDLDLDFS